MVKIIIGFSRARSKTALFSKGIMWAQGTPFSHVYIKLNWKAINKLLIYQASGLQVNFESWDHFQTHAVAVSEFEIDVSDETYKKIASFMYDQLNKPYSIKQILGMCCVLFGQKFNLKIENPYKNRSDAFVCSELVIDIIKTAGITIEGDPEDMGPLEVFNFLHENFADKLILL